MGLDPPPDLPLPAEPTAVTAFQLPEPRRRPDRIDGVPLVDAGAEARGRVDDSRFYGVGGGVPGDLAVAQGV